MDKIKVAFLGCEPRDAPLEQTRLDWKPYSLAEAFKMHPRCELVAAQDRVENRVRVFSRQWQIKRIYLDHLDLLAQERPDLVNIGGSVHDRETTVVDAATFGVRAIVCHRPLARHSSAAGSMLDACRRTRTALVMNRAHYMDEHHRTAKGILDSGRIGKLKTIVGFAYSDLTRSCSRHRESGESPLFQDSEHLVDLFRYFAGPISWVVAHQQDCGSGTHPESNSVAMVHFTKGGYGFLQAAERRGLLRLELDIQCTQGRILLGPGVAKLFETLPSSTIHGFTEYCEVDFPSPPGARNPFSATVETLLECLEGNQEPESSGLLAGETVAALEAMQFSAQKDSRKVHLDGKGKGVPKDRRGRTSSSLTA